MNRLAIHDVLLVSDDVVAEILSHLPVRSLLRFKTVNKSWHDIIDSWAFTKLHLENYCNNCSNNNGILVRVYDGNTKKWKLSTKFLDCSKLCGELTLDNDFLELFSKTEQSFIPRMVGAIDGLICIYGVRPSTPIALCNPSLAETQTLPMSPISSTGVDLRNVGFGFDFVHKDLKVVQLLTCFSTKPYRLHVEVYSQSTNTWREILDHQIPNYMSIKKAIMPYKNGSFCFSHWLAFQRFQPFDDANFFILSFNMQNEVFERTPLPPCVHDAADAGQLKLKFFAKDDSLLLFVYPLWERFSLEDECFGRWLLNGLGDKGRWTRLSSVGPLLGVPKPLALWKSHELVFKRWGEEKKLILYNSSTQEIRNTVKISKKQYGLTVLGYKGSLISPVIFMKAQL
ncbi:putative F-box protein [Sesamum alatum]|uniref:F-box protein n=1 Tax=Sesamum alatum TaxID=300844 RepID=A0AAE1Y7Q0_9LAMI|nr:putative F-box protein [Sesamum alatum]